MSRRHIRIAVFFAVLLVVAFAIRRPAPTAAQSLASIARSEQKLASEQWWLVTTVLRAVQDLASAGTSPASSQQWVMAREGLLMSGSRPVTRYAVVIGDRPLNSFVDVTKYVWDPDAYKAAAAELLRTPRPDSDVMAPSILPALSDARLDALHEVNDHVSAALVEHLRSPALHQQAALLLGAFALRESAAYFSDSRPVMCRIAAHLAVARALDPRPVATTLDGRVAEAILLALAGRQVEALAAVDAIRTPLVAMGQEGWVRTLQLRVTEDWRTPTPATAPLIERLEHVRAVRARGTTPMTLDAVDAIGSEALAEWGRVVTTYSVSIEAGHRFVPDGLAMELDDARRTWTRFHAGDVELAQLVAALNVPLAPGPVAGRVGPHVAIIDWSLWAAFFQRNLCDWLVIGADHFRNLGLPDDERDWNAHADASFAELRLYPLVLRHRARERKDFDAAVERGRALIMQSPQLVTEANWRRLVNGRPFDAPITNVPPEAAWFVPAIPVGTTFDMKNRAWGIDGNWSLQRADVATLHAMAPYSHELVWEILCERYGEPIPRPPAEVVHKEMGGFESYDVKAMDLELAMLDEHPDDYLPVAQRICAVDASMCGRQADYLLDLGREADAARVYERLVEGSRDRVSVSSSVAWLVHYYHDTGRRDRALEIAQMAADTYSGSGLETLADELDRLGRDEQAEAVYQKIRERYDDSRPLLSFYLREARREGRPLNNDRTASLIRKFFGEAGLQVSNGPPAGPPVDGVHVYSLGLSARSRGLALEDIVVALDGYRIHNTEQYVVVKWSRDDDEMALLVWRDGKYVIVHASVPRKMWQVSIRDYRPDSLEFRRPPAK